MARVCSIMPKLVAIFLLLVSFAVFPAVNAATREVNLTVTPKWLAPYGHWRSVYTINGQTPGPLLDGDEGDTFLVHVTNNLPVEITMHFHGIYQKKPWNDGVPGVTQWNILSYGTFTYEWTAEQYGLLLLSISTQFMAY